MKRNAISMHSTVAGTANLASMTDAARKAGFDCVEPEYHMLYRYLNAGHTTTDMKKLFDGLDTPALGWLQDIECQGESFHELQRHAELLFELCEAVGIRGVQLLTGPISYKAVEAFRSGTLSEEYMGLQHLDIEQQLTFTAANMTVLAEQADKHHVTLYLEPLCWTPLGSIRYGKELIERVNRDNMRLVVDFWHCYVRGDTPEDIAALPAEYIYGVHICDSKQPTGGIPVEDELRAVPLGEGVLPVKDWIAAVKATGFDGWWACESFALKEKELVLSEAASLNYHNIDSLI